MDWNDSIQVFDAEQDAARVRWEHVQQVRYQGKVPVKRIAELMGVKKSTAYNALKDDFDDVDGYISEKMYDDLMWGLIEQQRNFTLLNLRLPDGCRVTQTTPVIANGVTDELQDLGILTGKAAMLSRTETADGCERLADEIEAAQLPTRLRAEAKRKRNQYDTAISGDGAQ